MVAVGIFGRRTGRTCWCPSAGCAGVQSGAGVLALVEAVKLEDQVAQCSLASVLNFIDSRLDGAAAVDNPANFSSTTVGGARADTQHCSPAPHRDRRRMRSSVAQRLVSNLVASISSRSSLVLPSTPSAPEALWRPCLLRSWQPVRASAGLLVQHIGLRGLTGATAASCSYPHGWRASLGSPTTLSCWQEQQRTQLRQQRCLHASPALQQEFVTLNNLQDNEGARRWVCTSASNACSNFISRC